MSSQYCIDLAPGYTISRLLKGGWQLAGGKALTGQPSVCSQRSMRV